MESEIFLEDTQNIFDNQSALNYLQESLERTFETINKRYVELYSSPKYLAGFLLFYFTESIKTNLEWHNITSMNSDFEDEEDYYGEDDFLTE